MVGSKRKVDARSEVVNFLGVFKFQAQVYGGGLVHNSTHTRLTTRTTIHQQEQLHTSEYCPIVASISGDSQKTALRKQTA
jgi:hypothetical protein